MNATPVVRNPAAYVTPVAIGTTDASGNLSLIGNGSPLPIALSPTPGAPAIAGTLTSSGLVGPFIPSGPAAIVIQLDGDWSGTVRLVRSVDGGQSVSPLKIAGSEWAVYTANGVEQAWTETEAGASFYLNAEITSGTLAYRVSQ